jgi:hypothetical protein
MGVGPYHPGDIARIPLEVTLNGEPRDVMNPRVYKLILPNKTEAPGFPRIMERVDVGTYILEFTVQEIGNYTSITRAEFQDPTLNHGVAFTIEEIDSFVVEMGYYKISPTCTCTPCNQ